MKYFFALIVSLLLLCAPAKANSIEIWAEKFAPLSYSEKGKITGFTTEIVKHLIEDSGVLVNDWTLAPWARAYHAAKSTPNTLLYTVVRKPDREELFHWIGPISDRKIHLFKMKDRKDVVVTSRKEAGKYSVGALREAAANEPLTSAGVTLDESPTPETQFQKLVRGRNDLSIFLDFTLFYLARKNGFAPEDFTPVLLLDDSKKYYITLNKETDASIVKALGASFEKMKTSGALEGIARKYFSLP